MSENNPHESGDASFKAIAADILLHQGLFTWREYKERHGCEYDHHALQARWKRWAKRNGHPIELKKASEMVGEKPPPPPEQPADEAEQFQTKIQQGNFITTDSFASYLYNENDVADFFKIDRTIWEVDRAITNYWEQGAKITVDGKVLVAKTPLYQLKLTWKRKNLNIEKAKSILAEQIILPDFSTVTKLNTDGKTLSVQPMIVDLHLGKIGFNPETMAFNWTLQEAAAQYHKAIEFFLSRLDTNEIAEFVLPIGNDYLNVDNSSNQTRKGTPQMAGEFWQQVFRFGKNLQIAVIERLASIAPVKVYVVPGNHDEDSAFAMGEVLDAYFSGHPNVAVDNTPIKRKYHEFGANMLGMSHGHEFKMTKAMQTMATDEPLMFGRTKFRSFHFGHLHQSRINKVIDLAYKEEHFGIDVEICPSLSPTDFWHYQNAYIGNLRRCKCFVRHRDTGLEREIYYNLMEDGAGG